MTFQGGWKEEKVVHLVGDNFVDKMPNSGAFPEEVGPVVDRLVRGLIVFEELKVVDARAISVLQASSPSRNSTRCRYLSINTTHHLYEDRNVHPELPLEFLRIIFIP